MKMRGPVADPPGFNSKASLQADNCGQNAKHPMKGVSRDRRGFICVAIGLALFCAPPVFAQSSISQPELTTTTGSSVVDAKGKFLGYHHLTFLISMHHQIAPVSNICKLTIYQYFVVL
jgi:hypothetical protein